MRHMVSEMSPRVLDAICRLDFATFSGRCFNVLYPSSRLQMNWHIRALAYHLDKYGRERSSGSSSTCRLAASSL